MRRRIVSAIAVGASAATLAVGCGYDWGQFETEDFDPIPINGEDGGDFGDDAGPGAGGKGGSGGSGGAPDLDGGGGGSSGAGGADGGDAGDEGDAADASDAAPEAGDGDGGAGDGGDGGNQPPPTATCTEPDGQVDPATGHCYFVVRSSSGAAGMNWDTARARCESFTGARLATIGSGEEQSFVEQLVSNATGDVWIGLRRSTRNGPFGWITGETLGNADYRNWNAGEPNQTGNTACVRLRSESATRGRWSDISCTNQYRALCEREP